MNNENLENKTADEILADKELVEKILKEKGIDFDSDKARKSRINQEALTMVAMTLVFFVLGTFIVSPFIQLLARMITDWVDPAWNVGVSRWIDRRVFLKNYQTNIKNINAMVHFTALFLYAFCLYRIIKNRKEVFGNLKKRLNAALPFIIFILFVIAIALVTHIRGFNEYDRTGHPYMFESIYSYMLYPMTYFFCGMFVYKSSYKKILLYALLFTALPLNLLALAKEWLFDFPYFYDNDVVAVFHNSNHYGYYLALVTMTSALLFVYEEVPWRKCFSLISMCISTIVLVMNNTLGAFLAICFSMILFFFYVKTMNKKTGEGAPKGTKFFKAVTISGSWQAAVFAFGLFLLLVFILSYYYHTILSSFFVLFGDVGDILEDPLESDSAGSGRWRLWKGAAQHIVEHPILGFGVEGLLNTYHIGTPHNEFLQYAENFGVITTFLYIAAAWLVMWRVFRNCRKMSQATMLCFFVSIVYLASSFFGVAIYYTTPFIYIFLGLTYAEYFNLEVKSI